MINVGSEETDNFIFADGQMATLIPGFHWSKTALDSTFVGLPDDS